MKSSSHCHAKVLKEDIGVIKKKRTSVRTDLMFNDEDGTNCFDNQILPMLYTPTDEVQTSGGDEGYLDLHGLTRELMLISCESANDECMIDSYYAEVHEGTAQRKEGTAEEMKVLLEQI
ncbi:hypothetical protein Tco_1235818 [Tanacetum coccineum]|uniref:Uncharacterized protein n=1 Tax=Tanacetum coccineum TaxID=301880 RepID=A0ABQ4YYS9_9ASTR